MAFEKLLMQSSARSAVGGASPKWWKSVDTQVLKYLEAQDYKWINTYEEAKREASKIKKAGRAGIRVAFDSEEGYLDEYSEVKPLVMGTCIKPGRVRVFAIEHPDGRAKSPRERQRILSVVAGLLRNKHIGKVMHHGVSDCNASKKLYGVTVRNFYWDTEYSEFFKNPGEFSYGLKYVANARFREFKDYATLVIANAIPEEIEGLSQKAQKSMAALMKKYNNGKATVKQVYDFYRKRGFLNYTQLTKQQMLLYNGADCDLTKRIELTTKKDCPEALLKVYVDCSFVLDAMQKKGPYFDYTHYEKLRLLYPPRLKAALKYLRKKAGKHFNPGSPPQVKEFIYRKLKLKYDLPLGRKEKPETTEKGRLEYFARKNEWCKQLLVYRRLAKIVSTYLESFERCATENGGRLRTKWWLTGTGTGRLSSGGNKDESVDTVVNLQNVHGDPMLQDQLVPDADWRKLYNYGLKYFKRLIGDLDINNDRERIVKRIRGEKWKRYATKILAKYGELKIFLGFDFGQIEVRVLAQLCGDKQLIADCESGDIHSAVGHAMTGWAVEKIKKDKKTRTLTKNIHFGILFGLNALGVYKFIKAKDPDTKITLEMVEEYYANYFKRYPGVKKLVAKLRAQAEKNGYVENMFGFRRPLNVGGAQKGDANEDREQGGAYWGNQAINTPVQGAAHHLMLMAVAALKRKKKEYIAILGTPIMEVHDALYFFVKVKDMLKALALGKQLLTQEPLETIKRDFPEVDFKVGLAVEGKTGFRLGDTIETEEGGEVFPISDLLGSMILETYARECTLDNELAAAA